MAQIFLRLGLCTKVSYVDSTPLRDCKHQRILIHKTFKGYIGKQLFEDLFMNGLKLVTNVKNNMKNSLMIIPCANALVESVNDELKNIAQIGHSRHRSFTNFMANALSAIAVYGFFPKKPSISLEFVFDNQLTLL